MKKLLLLSVVGCCCLTSSNVCFADDMQDIRDGVRDLQKDMAEIKAVITRLNDLSINLSQQNVTALSDGIKALNINLSQQNVTALSDGIKALNINLSQSNVKDLLNGVNELNTNLSQNHVDTIKDSILEVKNMLNTLNYSSTKIEQINASQVSPANVAAAPVPPPMAVYVPTVPQPTMAAYTHTKTPSIFGTVGDIFSTLWGSNRY